MTLGLGENARRSKIRGGDSAAPMYIYIYIYICISLYISRLKVRVPRSRFAASAPARRARTRFGLRSLDPIIPGFPCLHHVVCRCAPVCAPLRQPHQGLRFLVGQAQAHLPHGGAMALCRSAIDSMPCIHSGASIFTELQRGIAQHNRGMGSAFTAGLIQKVRRARNTQT